jgi:hypothetical protein
MILNGFGFVAFFAGVKVSSFCIHLSCPVCIQSAVRGVWSHLFFGHWRCGLPEGSIISFLPPHFFVSQFSDQYRNVRKTKVLYNFKIVSVLTFLKIVLLIVPINCNHDRWLKVFKIFLCVLYCNHQLHRYFLITLYHVHKPKLFFYSKTQFPSYFYNTPYSRITAPFITAISIYQKVNIVSWVMLCVSL